VGAIAVLFLFVIMMLEIKIMDSLRLYDFDVFKQILIYLMFSSIVFWVSTFLSSQMLTDNYFDFEENCNVAFDLVFDLQIFGQIIYNYYILCVLLGGIILLVAVLGAIVLTLKLNNKQQVKSVVQQLARSENFLSFFKI
jgi:NADH-quinone oxidoreductase subunit J